MPALLGTILVVWCARGLVPQLSLAEVPAEDRPYVVGARVLLLGMLGAACWLARVADRRRSEREGSP
jgi:hypothetical protein